MNGNDAGTTATVDTGDTHTRAWRREPWRDRIDRLIGPDEDGEGDDRFAAASIDAGRWERCAIGERADVLRAVGVEFTDRGTPVRWYLEGRRVRERPGLREIIELGLAFDEAITTAADEPRKRDAALIRARGILDWIDEAIATFVAEAKAEGGAS